MLSWCKTPPAPTHGYPPPPARTEGNVPVRADAAQEELHAAQIGDTRLVGVTLGLQVCRVAVENVDVSRAARKGRDGGACEHRAGESLLGRLRERLLRQSPRHALNVDELEEVVPHVAMVRLRVVTRDADVLVHAVKGGQEGRRRLAASVRRASATRAALRSLVRGRLCVRPVSA